MCFQLLNYDISSPAILQNIGNIVHKTKKIAAVTVESYMQSSKCAFANEMFVHRSNWVQRRRKKSLPFLKFIISLAIPISQTVIRTISLECGT